MKNNRPKAILAQIKSATAKTNRMAFMCGSVLGGIVPVSSWWLVHHEVLARPAMWVIVTGGLIFSASTVYNWANIAYRSGMKALGFTVLLEGILTFSDTAWLNFSALAYLVVINAIATATNLVNDRRGE